jgi:hypothetical protein
VDQKQQGGSLCLDRMVTEAIAIVSWTMHLDEPPQHIVHRLYDSTTQEKQYTTEHLGRASLYVDTLVIHQSRLAAVQKAVGPATTT